MAGVIVLPPLHSGQRDIARSAVRHRLVICGRRWGKTRLGVALALEAMVQGRQCWWVAPVYAQADLAYRQLVSVASALHGIDVSRSGRAIRWRGGSVVCRSADREDTLRGVGLDLLVVDEADYIGERVWTDVLRPTLTDRRGRSVMLSTPAVEGGWLHRWYVGAQRGERADTEVWHRPTWTSPLISAAELEDARRELPSITWRREYGAEWVSAAGARVRREWVVDGPAPPREALTRVVVGVDLAISTRDTADWTAIAVLGRDRNGVVWLLDATRMRAPFAEVLRAVAAVADRWAPNWVAVEDVAYQRAVSQELSRQTLHAVRPVRVDSDKQSRFAPIEARYEQGLMRHATGLPDWVRDEITAFPVAAHDDLVDAMSTAWAALANGGSTRSIRL